MVIILAEMATLVYRQIRIMWVYQLNLLPDSDHGHSFGRLQSHILLYYATECMGVSTSRTIVNKI